MWKVTLNETLTLYANSHTPSTGGVVDSDAVPSYRIYEGTTTAPILTGNLALHDDANTTGFYSVDIAVTIANGFEAGKTYCARILATVGGVPGADLFVFAVTARGLDDILPTTTYTAPPAVGDIADAVWDEASAQHVGAGTTGIILTTVQADTDDIQARLPAALVGGRIDASIGAVAAGVLTAIVAAVWNALTSGLTTVGSIGKLLVTNIDAKISTVGGAGAGAISYTITVTKDGNPADGVEVWVSTDSAGVSVAASGTTGAAGTVSFMLDAGTYYVWCQLAGTDFTNPTTIVVS